MTHVMSRPQAFADDALAGLCDLYSSTVRRVRGGVVRATATPKGKVAVVVGGGSGHYPLFAGYVGPGLADAAVCGDVFASPSARQVQDVVHAASRGGGAVLTFGNYTGDALNFGLAAERLAAEGTDVRIVTVTDDIASAPVGQESERRGIAGNVVVFKVAGAAAEAGYDLDGVERVTRLANGCTRSFGVAFAGCTLPGAETPLFTVPEGRMALGLGIHGEPGIDETPLLAADELAGLLVDRVLAEAPTSPSEAGPRRVAVLLNGLGATKYEELFGLWRYVAPRLKRAGLEVVAPEVGELATSLDMAGCSLTVAWLDDETHDLWLAPAQAPALRRGHLIATDPAPVTEDDEADAAAWPEASESSRRLGGVVVDALHRIAAQLSEAEDELGRLDAVAGDGDHGRGMARGSAAAAETGTRAADAGAGVASLLAAAADAWADSAGGTSGVLWGAGLRAAAAQLDDTAGAADVGAADAAGLDAVSRLGGAQVGDKTLVDALSPFASVLAEQLAGGTDPGEAWRLAVDAAHRAAEGTSTMTPRKGRARPLAERSIGHADPGAVSLALCARAAAPPARP